MKKLLNELIRKGRKPRGKEGKIEFSFMLGGGDSGVYELNFLWGEYPIKVPVKHSIRELVAKESGLWQFVCENKMEKKMEKNHRGIWINSWAKSAYQSYPVYTMERYEYRIIESALKDEDELEEFLLSNIDVEGK